MHFSLNSYKNVLRIVGFIFICTGCLMGYSAFEAMLDPNIYVVLNGLSRNDVEAKLMGLFIPCIITFVGFWLCLSKDKSFVNLHKIRKSFWSVFHGK
jgi:hypothetical protein